MMEQEHVTNLTNLVIKRELEIDKLQAENKLMREELEYIAANDYIIEDCECPEAARKTLAKLSKEGGSQTI